jgi:hypothetical protein
MYVNYNEHVIQMKNIKARGRQGAPPPPRGLASFLHFFANFSEIE